MDVEKKMTETKVDVGKQMHELCFMVEQLATMTRGFEAQFGAKKPEIESANMNIANLQRKIDEMARSHQSELNGIKKRQYELTELYSTCLESEDNPIGGGIASNSRNFDPSSGQAPPSSLPNSSKQDFSKI